MRRQRIDEQAFLQERKRFRGELQRYADDNPEYACGLRRSGVDPGIERLIDAVSWLITDSDARLGSEVPHLHRSLVSASFPSWLRHYPCMSVVQVTATPNVPKPCHLPAGSLVTPETQGMAVCFRTARDVELTNVRIERAFVRPTTVGPNEMILEIRTDDDRSLPSWPSSDVPVFVAGVDDDRGAVLHALAVRREMAVIELLGKDGAILATVEEHEQGSICSVDPLLARGASPDAYDGLLPDDASPRGGLLLRDFVAFPAAFRFFTLRLSAVAQKAATLCQPVHCLRVRIPVGRRLAECPDVSPERLLLHCTPIVNLHAAESMPVSIRPDQDCYVVVPRRTEVDEGGIWQIERLELLPPHDGFVAAAHRFEPVADDGRRPLIAWEPLHRDEAAGQGAMLRVSFGKAMDLWRTDRPWSFRCDLFSHDGEAPMRIGRVGLRGCVDGKPHLRFRGVEPIQAPLANMLRDGDEHLLIRLDRMSSDGFADVDALRMLLDTADRSTVRTGGQRRRAADQVADYRRRITVDVVRGALSRCDDVQIDLAATAGLPAGEAFMLAAAVEAAAALEMPAGLGARMSVLDPSVSERIRLPVRGMP